MNAVNAIILAGGKNSRMGGLDKAFLEIEGQPIIRRLIDTLRPLVNEIIVVTNNPAKYSNFKVRLVKDESLDRGPLMGLYSGLKASTSQYNFVAACDMPCLRSSLIKFMLDTKDDYDILILRVSEKFHTLFGVYSKNCIPVIKEALEEDELRIGSIFPKLNVHFLSKKDVEKYDSNLLSLVNINTPEELERIKQQMIRENLKCQR